jgi:hypothetical protein
VRDGEEIQLTWSSLGAAAVAPALIGAWTVGTLLEQAVHAWAAAVLAAISAGRKSPSAAGAASAAFWCLLAAILFATCTVWGSLVLLLASSHVESPTYISEARCLVSSCVLTAALCVCSPLASADCGLVLRSVRRGAVRVCVRCQRQLGAAIADQSGERPH